MSMNQLQPEVLKILALGKNNQTSIIKRLDQLYRQFGVLNIEKWRHISNKKNSLLHALVEKELPEVVSHIIIEHKFDVNIRRDSDGLTPLQLAADNENFEMCELLKGLGAENIQTEDVSQWSPDEDREKALNIIWLDLEMTSIEDPEILECAVIITDKDLHELAQGSWVIHFEKDVLEKLADWHQETFADRDQGGNGLFADVLKSKLTKDQVEEELLALIKRYCPKGKCPLAGSSIHTDKDVLKRCMPKVNDYLTYRIIDVSSFQAIMRRWAPWMETKIKKQLAANDQETVNHRAMDDIKWSMAFMKQFRVILTKQQEPSHSHSPSNHHNKGASHEHKPGASNYHNKGESHEHKPGASNYYNKGALNEHKPGASDYHNKGESNQYKQGASNYHNQGASNYGNHGASNHQFKRSVSESQASGGSELPMISPGVDSSELYNDERRLVERIALEKKFDVKSLKLPEKYQRMYDGNPHLREVFMNRGSIEKYDKDFTKENRFLTARIQGLGNNNMNVNPKKFSTTEHWGQRKLLLTEIEFLTKYGTDDHYLVVYAGAAPGLHVAYLSSLFPQLEFILIDDKEFSLKQTNRIQIRPEKFTKDMAKRYSDSPHKVLFICNVRTFRAQGDGQNDEMEDMQKQMDWHTTMKPHVSLLYFRLPHEPGKTSYLKGHQMIEPWASKRPTECRLVVKKDARTIDYDNQEFEENLLRFQHLTRVTYYKHNMDEVENEGLDHCYDCRTEIFILQEYLTKMQSVKNESQLKTGIAAMSLDISKNIDDKKRPRFIDVPRTLNVIPKISTNISTNM